MLLILGQYSCYKYHSNLCACLSSTATPVRNQPTFLRKFACCNFYCPFAFDMATHASEESSGAPSEQYHRDRHSACVQEVNCRSRSTLLVFTASGFILAIV